MVWDLILININKNEGLGIKNIKRACSPNDWQYRIRLKIGKGNTILKYQYLI